ncbi:MAG: hypothetical protein PQJ60_03960, partial [Spirochaetales bacterium]|nr:hypothetical protein [Spirochaetales bacterium]
MKNILNRKALFLLLMMLTAYLFSALIIALFSRPVTKGWESFFLTPFLHRLYLGNWLNRAVLYLLSGSAVVLAFQGGEFNLGGEGQICLGGLVTVITLHFFQPAHGWIGLVLVFFLSSLASGGLAALSGWVKNLTGLSEVITTYLLSMAVILLARFFIAGPLQDENSYLVTTAEIPARFQLTEVLPPSHLNLSFLPALMICVMVYLFLFYRPSGYEWRLCGINGDFAAYCGINRKR